jgi:multiple antibiotic resistance protein
MFNVFIKYYSFSILVLNIDKFTEAAGALLFIISLEIMRHGELRNVENDIQGTGVIPIAFPLIAGPGAILQL